MAKIDKSKVVLRAVIGQLRNDGLIARPSKTMAGNYKYDLGAMKVFLSCVDARLADKKCSFKYDATFVSAAIGLTVGDLVHQIAERTTGPSRFSKIASISALPGRPGSIPRKRPRVRPKGKTFGDVG